MAKAKRKKVKLLTGCPKCGGIWKRLSGFVVCSKCGHRSGTQHLEVLKSTFGQRIASNQVLYLGDPAYKPVDDEEGQLPIAGRAKEL